jgi:hypothetical protein
LSEAIFTLDGGRYVASELARGPWDPNAQHGGAPAALLMGEIEGVDGDQPMQVTRVTYEFLKPVPLGELEVETKVVRPGRRVQLIESSMKADGTEVCRAVGLRVRRKQVGPAAPAEPVTGPDGIEPATFPFPPGHVFFGTDAIEIRFSEGEWLEPGPSTAWFRLRHPIVAGEPSSPLQRLVAAADFPNGISSPVRWHDHLFVNPDLTVYVEREPEGDWIGVEAETRFGGEGAGVSEAVLYDERGRVGRSLQSLYVDRREQV